MGSWYACALSRCARALGVCMGSGRVGAGSRCVYTGSGQVCRGSGCVHGPWMVLHPLTILSAQTRRAALSGFFLSRDYQLLPFLLADSRICGMLPTGCLAGPAGRPEHENLSQMGTFKLEPGVGQAREREGRTEVCSGESSLPRPLPSGLHRPGAVIDQGDHIGRASCVRSAGLGVCKPGMWGRTLRGGHS